MNRPKPMKWRDSPSERWRRPPGAKRGQVLFMVYRAPRDFITGYVVRAFEVKALHLEPLGFVEAGSLLEVRQAIPREAKTRMRRPENVSPIVFELFSDAPRAPRIELLSA
jgi:hypothetical protein